MGKALTKIIPFPKSYFFPPASPPKALSWAQSALTPSVGNVWRSALCRGFPCSEREERFQLVWGLLAAVWMGICILSLLPIALPTSKTASRGAELELRQMNLLPTFLSHSKLSSGWHSKVHSSFPASSHPTAGLLPPRSSMEADPPDFVQSRATSSLNWKPFWWSQEHYLPAKEQPEVGFCSKHQLLWVVGGGNLFMSSPTTWEVAYLTQKNVWVVHRMVQDTVGEAITIKTSGK